MQFTLTINCDGAAFDEYPSEEVAAVLTRLLDTSPGFSHRNLATADPGDRTEDNPFLLYDVNGARVGVAYFEEL